MLRSVFFAALAGLATLWGLPEPAGASVRMIMSAHQPPAPDDSAAPATTQTALQILYGGAVSREMAVNTGYLAVRFQALEQAARRLSTRPAARLMTDEIPRLMALCAPMLQIQITDEDIAPDTVRVVAHSRQFRTEDAVLREHSAAEQTLDFQGMAYGNMRRLCANALRLLRDAAILRREDSDDSPQVQRLESILVRMKQLDSYLQGTFPPEAKQLAALLAVDPKNPVYLLEYAAAQLRAAHPASALNALKKLDVDTADSPRALHLQGLAELSLRLPGLALRDFSKALTLNPDDPTFWEARAGAYNALGDVDAMCRDLRQSCSLGLCTALEEAHRKDVCTD